MKKIALLALVLAFQGCVDERGCYYDESDSECEERQAYVNGDEHREPLNYVSVGVYRCESNIATMVESQLVLAESGIDFVSYACADLFDPIHTDSENCPGGFYNGIDVLQIHLSHFEYALQNDSLNVVGSDLFLDYATRNCE